MIALDTNVLVRFLVEDDPRQCRKARDLLARCVADEEEILLTDIVLCETVWVLSVSYRLTRAEIADALDQLLRARGLVLQDAAQVHRALAAFRDGRGDFADYLIRAVARSFGCDRVATFDRKLLREPDFEAP
jgi:predicted nucleic-acid-binding protein